MRLFSFLIFLFGEYLIRLFSFLIFRCGEYLIKLFQKRDMGTKFDIYVLIAIN